MIWETSIKYILKEYLIILFIRWVGDFDVHVFLLENWLKNKKGATQSLLTANGAYWDRINFRFQSCADPFPATVGIYIMSVTKKHWSDPVVPHKVKPQWARDGALWDYLTLLDLVHLIQDVESVSGQIQPSYTQNSVLMPMERW